MKDEEKEKEGLIRELVEMRLRISEFEESASERDKIERELRVALDIAEQEKAKTEAILASIGDAISIQDTDFLIIYQNERHKNLFGEHVGAYCYKAYRNTQSVCKGCPLELSFRAGEVLTTERSLPAKYGMKYLEVTTAPLRDSDGTIRAGIEVVRDVTERRRAGDALRLAHAELDQIFNTAADGMRIIDKNFTTLRVNRTFSTLSGTGMHEVVGKKCYEVFRGSTCYTPDCPVTRILNGEERVEYEVEKVRNDGTPIPCIMSATPFRSPDGELIGIVEDFKDITERKQAEEILAAERERLAVTLLSIGDGVITTDREGRVVLMNRVAQELTGWTLEESIGKPLDTVFHIINEITRERCENPVEKVLHSGGIVGLANHTALIAKDGTERVIADSGAPIREKESKIIGVVLVFRDVSEKRRMEEDLLRNQKLESIGILAGGIAHDFNNLLTGILGNISLAKTYLPPGGEAYKRLDEAEKASLRTKDLTRQLLTFSKGGAPVKRMITLRELIIDSAGFSLAGSNFKCDYSIPGNLRPVEVDEGQISQVINNMVINACQAMPGGGTIRLECENVTVGEKDIMGLEEGAYVKISVEDRGVGIPREHLKKIFSPYFTTKEQGRGLGLATCYSIIKNHDGHISFETRPGEGTTFNVYLPASRKGSRMEKKEEESFLAGKGKILVMDDEEIVREVACTMLRTLGYEVEVAGNGREAIELYVRRKESGQPFSAVIMDLTVPGGMGGRETVEKLKKIDRGVRAIVSSGYSNDPIMADYRKFGFNGVITKPYRINELSKTVFRVITKP